MEQKEKGLLSRFKKLFEPCEHIWRFAGSGLRAALVPEWIFKCRDCSKTRWRAEGCFPDEESFAFYKDKMGDDFKPEWSYVVSESMNQVVLSRNLERIKGGTYFDEVVE